MEFLAPTATRHDAEAIEDAAQSQGACSGIGLGRTLGAVAATSTFPGENLCAVGDGQAVLADDDDDVAEHVRNVEVHAHLDGRREQCPVAEAAANRILSRPIFPHLKGVDQASVAEMLRSAA